MSCQVDGIQSTHKAVVQPYAMSTWYGRYTVNPQGRTALCHVNMGWTVCQTTRPYYMPCQHGMDGIQSTHKAVVTIGMDGKGRSTALCHVNIITVEWTQGRSTASTWDGRCWNHKAVLQPYVMSTWYGRYTVEPQGRSTALCHVNMGWTVYSRTTRPLYSLMKMYKCIECVLHRA